MEEMWYCDIDTLFMEADDNQQMNGLRDWWGWHFNSCQWLGQVPKNHFLSPRPPIWFKEHIYEKWWLICLLWKPHQRSHTFNLETHNLYLVKHFHYFMISTTNQTILPPTIVVNIWDCVFTRRDRDINICVLGREPLSGLAWLCSKDRTE